MKIITKILAERMKHILNQVISQSQSAFIKGRLILDNFIVAHEISNYMKHVKSTNDFYASVKVDMSKAFDRVEWIFLKNLMLRMGFAPRWVDRIMVCVTSVSYTVNINGHLSDFFRPARGLRQGDPLSPYLFIICSEFLSCKMKEASISGRLRGISIGRGAPPVNHLFFADDSIFFVKAEVREAWDLNKIFNEYKALSGQSINLEKSEVVFSRNTPDLIRRRFLDCLNFVHSDSHNRYLGLPLTLGQRKSDSFRALLEKAEKRVSDWQFRYLSAAGREVLIKSVLQAIPTYMMSVFKLPKKVIDALTKYTIDFWWDKRDRSKKIHWVNLGTLQKKKVDGGLGFKNLSYFNDALLMKVCWRIVNNPNLLMSRILLAKYCRNDSLYNASLGSKSSEVWKGVMAVINTFLQGIWWDDHRGCFVWKFSSNGAFTVKSAYDFISLRKISSSGVKGEQSDSTHLRSFWKMLWKCDIPNKVKIFAWRLYYDKLPDARNLIKIDININAHCSICGYEMENALHITKNCWWTRCLMESMNVNIPNIDADYHNPADWLWDCFRLSSKPDFSRLLMCCWLSWKNRNRVRFNKGTWRVEEGCIIINNVFRLMKQSYWFDPRYNSLLVSKDNMIFSANVCIKVDGSWERDNRKAGIGIVAWDSAGYVNWVWADHIDGCMSASEVEGLALAKSLMVAEELNIDAALFETDSEDVFKAVSLGFNIDNWCLTWLGTVNRLLDKHKSWAVTLIGRDSNRAADMIACKARRFSWQWKCFDAIPYCIGLVPA